MISIIVALDDKLGIASTQKLGMLWHISADFKHFKALTLGHPIIMGRKTHESIGRVLPGRTNIVITRDQSLKIPGCEVVQSIKAAIDLAKKVESRFRHQPDRGSSVRPKADTGKIFIIGGAEIFRQALEQNLVDKLYVTKVAGDFHADIFFPDYSRFKLLKSVSDQEGQYRFSYLELVK